MQTRLSFLNSQAALESLPKVIDIMSKELSWSKKRQSDEFAQAKEFLMSMGLHPSLKDISFEDVRNGNVAARRSLGEHRTAELADPAAGTKAERRVIPVERSGGGT